MLFAATSAIDSLVCGAERGTQGSTQAHLVLASADAGHADDAIGHASGATHLCMHGHCHHAAAPASDEVRLAAASSRRDDAFSPRVVREPDSAILGRDKPPPRA